MPNRTICLSGNPNSGKTTLFNELTGANQRVGNWPGVTVERKEGTLQFENWQINLVDLPGIYSLDALDGQTGLDETVARDYLLSNEVDLVINIVDASNLERNLYLTTQIMEMRLPMVVVLNMTDVARDRGLKIDPTILSNRLGCPVVPMVAARSQGVSDLKQTQDRDLQTPATPRPYVAYPPVEEASIAALMPTILERETQSPADARWLALKLLEQNNQVAPSLGDPALVKLATENRRRIHQVQQEDIDIILADSRYGWIRQLVLGAAERTHEVSSTTSDRLDRLALNRWLGIPIFLGMMYALFLLTINVGGAFIDFFDIAAGTIFVDGFGQLLGQIGLPQWLIVLLANGMGGGIQTVATFIPIIGILFLFLALLEDSGYMARAAFVMDRFMRFIGLPGKSFVPMLIGFGCNVPAIMATRTLENKRDRLLTIMMNPFMSCGARLPVYALFAAAFFPIAGQNVVFGLYLIGSAMAIFTGLMLKNTLLKGEVSHFIMELPPYHLPTFKGVLLRAWERLKSFMFRAGKVIVLMVMVLSLLNSIGIDGSFGNEDSDRSVLSSVSRTVTPVFSPLGLQQENWPATVGIFTGVFAKEAVVGTLDSIYGALGEEAGSADEPFNFWGNIGAAFASIPANLSEVPGMLLDPLGLSVGDVSAVEAAAAEQEVGVGTFGAMVARFDGKVGAFAYLLFVLLYFPCAAAMGAVYRETNWGWTTFIGCWTTGLAYATATLFYQLGTFAQHPVQSIGWTVAVAIALGLTYVGMKLAHPRRQRHQQIAHEAH